MNILRKIKQMIDWAPVIWKDEDWDYGFILDLLDYKLKRMSPVIRNGPCAHAQHRALEIEQARLMLANIKSDPDNEWDSHWDQWHQFKEPTGSCPASEKECSKAHKASAEREDANWHKLWKHLDENMQGWWD